MIRTGTLTFPAEGANVVGAAYNELTAPPDYITIKGVFLNDNTDSGLKVMAVYEFDDDRAAEANAFLENRFQAFSAAPGVEYKFEDWTNAQELLGMLGDDMDALDVLVNHDIAFGM